MRIKAFHPNTGPTTKIAATTASASTTLDPFSNAVRIYNAGPNAARVKFSGPAGSALAATATDFNIPPNTVEIMTCGDATFVAAICDTGTAAIEFTSGEGV